MDKNFPILHFEFAPADDPKLRNDGYGKGMLILDRRPFWYSNTESDPQPFDWTWVGFLEQPAVIWTPLISEQAYPFKWLNDVAPDLGELWRCAESRWARLGDAFADAEEPILCNFDRRHNLAAGWKGIALPVLFWLRVGDSVLLSTENGISLCASFSACKGSIQTIGDTLKSTFEHSPNPRVVSAVRAWQYRLGKISETEPDQHVSDGKNSGSVCFPIRAGERTP
ncbi:hypothetical protein [Rugamonas sp. DEMB1]|uniref:hypothetical protein n=1 Tax=Rugamonas sp. DEMB1 TaxID=3039386 RepID=UPI00244A511B|nr:hypothetical protein [Rugamonas sp. DEMB1]WGG53277.1 hypothetical protein QC826_14885 [Rugamonas sp. DEMB1]